VAEPKGRKRAEDRARDPEAPPPTLGPLVCEWMERYLPHGPGPIQGQPYRLHADLEAFIWMAYELQLLPGGRAKRRYTETVLTAPKGVAKSELAGARCCVEGLGPVQFDGWDANGDPVGRERQRAEVLVFALDEEQAGNTYLNVSMMLDCRDEGLATEALRDDYGFVDIGVTPESSSRTVLPDGRGLIKPMSARARSKEGSKGTFSVLEETHLWTLPTTHDLHETLVRTARKTGTTVQHATNLYGPGEDSVLERLDKDRAGGAKDLLWFQRSASIEVLPLNIPLSTHSDKVLRSQLREAYGSCDYVDLDDIISGIRRVSSDDAKIRRFFFNMAATSAGKWMKAAMWDARKSDAHLEPGDTITLGFDGARTMDATVLVACRVSDGLLAPVRVWERPPDEQLPISETTGKREWRVSESDVYDALRETFAMYRVVRMYADPPQWQTDIERWGLEFGNVETPEGKSSPIVAEWPTNREKPMSEAIERFDTAVLIGELSHTGADDLRRHVLNAVKVTTRYGFRLGKARQREYIDAAVGAILAYEAACDARVLGLDGLQNDPNEVFVH
jgi:phage terminase large subunit-like protein